MVDVPPTVILWTVPRGCGNDPPPRPAELPASFRAVFEAFRERAAMAPTFLRSAAYAVMNHLGEVDWSGMRHCILIRDPRYVLPSHRRFVPDITVEEAGYVAQRRLYRHLAASAATPPLVLDVHELLTEPAARGRGPRRSALRPALELLP